MLEANAQFNPYLETTFLYLAEQQAANLSTSLPTIASSLQTKYVSECSICLASQLFVIVFFKLLLDVK